MVVRCCSLINIAVRISIFVRMMVVVWLLEGSGVERGCATTALQYRYLDLDEP